MNVTVAPSVTVGRPFTNGALLVLAISSVGVAGVVATTVAVPVSESVSLVSPVATFVVV